MIKDFNTFVNETSDTEGVYVDRDTPSTFLEDAYDLADARDVGILRGKDPFYLELSPDHTHTVGALFVESTKDEFSFDVVVAPNFERRGIGSKLVKIAIEEYESLKAGPFPDMEMSVHVTNPKMQSMLKGYGFTVGRDLGPKGVEMTLD